MESAYIGIPCSPGTALGKILVLDQEIQEKNGLKPTGNPECEQRKANAATEEKRLENALAIFRKEAESLVSALSRNHRAEDASILEAYLTIADDPMIAEEVRRFLEDGVPAEDAVNTVYDAQVQKIGSLEDPYLRERSDDILNVKKALLQRLGPARAGKRVSLEGHILVGEEISPFVLIKPFAGQPSAILTNKAGQTSHLAILARAMQIPMVTNIEGLSALIRDAEKNPEHLCIVNGDTGEVIADPGEDTLREFEETRKKEIPEEGPAGEERAEATDAGTSPAFFGNIAFPREAETVVSCGGAGVGLFRTEFLGADYDNPESYETAAAVLGKLPLVVRTLDLGGDKIPEGFSGLSAFNGVGGSDDGTTRGIAYCLAHPDMFKPQLRAILTAYSKYPNIRILLPMVRTPMDIRETKELITKCSRELFGPGDHPLPKLGIMIETLEAYFLAEELAKEADFFSIGTNDLFAAIAEEERSSPKPRNFQYDAGLLKYICHIKEAGSNAGIPVCLCGEIAADPLLLPVFIGMGLKSFSVSAPYISELKRKSAGITEENGRKLANQVFCMDSEELLETLQKFS